MKTVNALYHQTASAIDEELSWIEASKVDPRQFGRLYQKYYTEIFRYIWKRVGDEELSATLVSNVFVKSLQSIQKYTYRGVPFSAWLYQIARNEINLFHRSNQRSRTVTMDSYQLKEVVSEMDEDSSEENIQLLLKGMDQLHPEELELLEMRYFEKRSFKEVSEILEIKEGTAKVKMHRVIQKLKDLILKS
ncbi:MAG: sigma-70 family RNA polymerase sigma factor [Flavobacteriales bacterium]|nr:sigma-70 family RNA polymerase sigma factor [Flavobacteriales bacterium]